MRKKKKNQNLELSVTIMSAKYGQHILKTKTDKPLFMWETESSLVKIKNFFYFNARHYAFLKVVREIKVPPTVPEDTSFEPIVPDIDAIKELGGAYDSIRQDNSAEGALQKMDTHTDPQVVVSEDVKILTFKHAVRIAERHLSKDERMDLGLFEYHGPYLNPDDIRADQPREALLCGILKENKDKLKALGKRRGMSVQDLIEEALTRKVYGVGAKKEDRKKKVSVIFYFTDDEMKIMEKAAEIFKEKTHSSRLNYSKTIRNILEDAQKGDSAK